MTEESKRGVSRRKFVAGTVAGLAVGAVVGVAGGYLGKSAVTTTSTSIQTATSTQTTTLPAVTSTVTTTTTTTAQPWLPASWDYSADVVVLGTGLAGLSTAIAAHDAGANVLILEKMPQEYEGGNSKVSGNIFWAPADVNLGTNYILAMQPGQYPDSGIASALSNGLNENMTLIKQMGGVFAPFSTTAEFPTQLPGASTVTEYAMVVNGQPVLGGGHLWQLYSDAVTSRNINIMYSTPATGLVQNSDTGEILGVTASTGGTASSTGVPTGGSTINVKANKGVVLACGGFEFNLPMQSQFQFGYPAYGYGTPGNTGDGIQMAQMAGADLWHMNQPSGGSPGVFFVPEYPYPMALVFAGIGSNYIWVGKDGNRFANESLGFASHGWGVKEFGMQFSGAQAAFLRIPSWLVFDDTARAAGPLIAPLGEFCWSGWYTDYTWSSDNSVEIAKGWITKADSIADLAATIASDSDNADPLGTPFMTASALEATITRFNGFVSSGTDSDFGRPKSTMAPIQTGPFYTVKLWPGIVNTNGGPRRNVQCQVVNPQSKPIPRLYSAGECGSFWGWMYQGGGNMGENMWTGRVAGANAAAETAWS